MSDDKFIPKEDTDTDENTDAQLNKKVTEGISSSTERLLLLLFSGTGFIIGAAILTGATVGFLCIFDIMNEITSSLNSVQPGMGGSSQTTDPTAGLQQQMIQCGIDRTFSILGITLALLGGIIGAMPGYKAAKYISEGKLLRALI